MSRRRPDRRPRVVHVTTTDMSLDWLLGPQLQAFVAAGFEVIGASAAGPHTAAIEAAGVRHVALQHATRSMAPRSDLRLLRELHQTFRRLRPDIVHTHNPKPGWLGRPAARRAGVPAVVNTVHGLYATAADGRARRAVVYGLERAAAAFSDAELVQSAEDLSTLRRLGVPRHRLHHLGNGVDLVRFRPVPAGDARARIRAAWGVGEREVLVGTVARLVREKGLLEVVAAAEAHRTTCPDARWVVIGPDDDAKGDALTVDQRRAAAAAGVVFAGRRDDMVDVYGALDVFVLASHREGVPRAAMEATAMALPLVVTDIRGCREVVEEQVNGVLVPVGDAAALAAAVARLVEDPALRTSLGEGGRRLAERRFDQQRVIDRTLTVYHHLLDLGSSEQREQSWT